MNLKPRLRAIANLVPPSNKLADIGTDHGMLPIFLVQRGRAATAVASDISAGSLEKAKQLIEQNNMEQKVEIRLGNGLSILSPGEADSIVIAGMGGVLIGEILQQGERAARSASTLILQPMTGQEKLRRWLIHNQYRIIEEELVKEGHQIYEIIAAVSDAGVEEYENEIFYEIGWDWIAKKHPLLKEWLLKKIQNLEEVTANLEMGKTQSAKVRLQAAEEKLEHYKEVYHCHIK